MLATSIIQDLNTWLKVGGGSRKSWGGGPLEVREWGWTKDEDMLQKSLSTTEGTLTKMIQEKLFFAPIRHFFFGQNRSEGKTGTDRTI